MLQRGCDMNLEEFRGGLGYVYKRLAEELKATAASAADKDMSTRMSLYASARVRYESRRIPRWARNGERLRAPGVRPGRRGAGGGRRRARGRGPRGAGPGGRRGRAPR